MRRRKKADHPAYSLLPTHETPGYPEAGQAEASTQNVTGESINFTALRAHAGVIDEAVPMTPRTVLALIDAVEASRRVHAVLSETPVIGRDRRLAGYLAPALERFTP